MELEPGPSQRIVQPSGLDIITEWVPIMLLPPGFETTSTGTPNIFDNFGLIALEKSSRAVPGPHGLIMLMGFLK